jgi:nucleoside-diphosphate-sugar epimerase
MKILLTGSNGFVGKNIYNELIKCGHDVNPLSRTKHDIRNTFTSDEKYEVIVHIAANSSAKSCIENPDSAVYDNIVGTYNMLEYARKINALFVFFSSCEVYGECDDTTKEDQPLKSFNMYGASKVSCEHMCQAYHYSYGLRCIVFRLLHTYGPHCQKERFASIIEESFKQNNKPHFIFHNNHKKRWLHICTMAERVVKVIENFSDNSFEIFNLVGDENITLEEFAKKFGKDFTFEYKDLNESGYKTHSNADGSKLIAFINSVTSR